MRPSGITNFRKSRFSSVFLLVVGLMVTSVGLTYWLGLEASESNQRLTELRLAIEQLDRLQGSVTEAETGQRGFLLTGKQSYLDPYHGALSAIEKELASLERMAAGGELPKEGVGRIKVLTEEKLSELRQTIADYGKHGPPAALGIVLSDRGKQAMDQLRKSVSDLTNVEEEKYRRAAAAARRATTIRTVVFLLTVFGNLALLIWAYQRIGDTVRMEKALRESEERFRLLFQQAAIGMKRLDLAEERMLDVNDRLCDILGYSRRELLQMRLADFTHPDDLDVERRELARLADGEIPYSTIEKRCLRKDGGAIWVRVTNSLPTRFAGRTAGNARARWWISVVEDITERKRADEALLRATAELKRSNEDLEQFAYAASHDLQEPLRMVAGYLQLLRERYQGRLDEKADKFINYAVDGAERMSSLVHDLLAYARVNSRGEQFEKTSAEDALCFALKNLSSAVAESGAEVQHDPLPTVRADRTQLRQLFQNLIGNAVKFRAPDRSAEIHVSAREDDHFWHFVVQDNGIGFDNKYRDKMFLIFQRLQGPGKFPGTGIGLAICKRIVERHGGEIWATGQPGEGSAFHFTIPIEGAA